ncbi:hypothetical protein NKH77_32165 [Streptomyces sp. M19]
MKSDSDRFRPADRTGHRGPGREGGAQHAGPGRPDRRPARRGRRPRGGARRVVWAAVRGRKGRRAACRCGAEGRSGRTRRAVTSAAATWSSGSGSSCGPATSTAAGTCACGPGLPRHDVPAGRRHRPRGGAARGSLRQPGSWRFGEQVVEEVE